MFCKNHCVYQFINIHQRTKTSVVYFVSQSKYQFINIHQRTKTNRKAATAALLVSVYQYPPENQNSHGTQPIKPQGISLSISTREPKPEQGYSPLLLCISLSISTREPKQSARSVHTPFCISLSISTREPKLLQAQGQLATSISLSISTREPKPQYLVDICGFGVFFTYSL